MAPSNDVLASSLEAVFGWIVSVFGSFFADCIKATSQHICLTSDGSSVPLTPYPSTPFLYAQQSYTDDDFEMDHVNL